MLQEKTKEEIRKVINDFKENYAFHKEHSEANTETRLVEPLFRALGWTEKDWTKQEQVHRGQKQGRADYLFKINDRIVFVLEVKKIGIPLEKEANRQVISYALSKKIPFAISTNFEKLNIFCVEQEDAINNKFRVFNSPEDYINNFNDLQFLSKESFEQNIILKKAEDEGRLRKRVSIDKTLLDDLMNVRKLIANDIEKTYPGKYKSNEKDEIVQRIIDRLIFIRKCEDTGISPNNLMLTEINQLSDNRAYPKLKEIFSAYNDAYDSELFAINEDNDCDKIKIDGSIIKKLLGHLYESKDKEYIYNFDWIDADVLGQVYEQYLGIILAQTKSGKAKLKEGQAHRKEQGIYYTPTYIVEYIVKNTVGELLKEKKDFSKIKILDPACGSGSFLIKAFDYLNEHLSDKAQRKLDGQGAYSVKTEILKNNIYGVDLDNKAVEITKLNLLLKAAEKNRKLPEGMHIKHGNSLIDDETIAGLNAFKWTGDFQEGSFDVVIGNPPYVDIKRMSDFEAEYYKTKYISADRRFDLYVVFLDKAISLLKNGGRLGFIIPEKFMTLPYGEKIREKILSECAIENIVDLTAFKIFQATVKNVILILKKEIKQDKRKNSVIKIVRPDKDPSSINSVIKNIMNITQNFFDITPNKTFRINIGKNELSVINKIKEKSFNLEKIAYISYGAQTGIMKNFVFDKKINILCKPFIKGTNIRRYSIKYDGKFLLYDIKKLHRPAFKELFESEKIIVCQVCGEQGIRSSLDDEKYYTDVTTDLCILKFELLKVPADILKARGIQINQDEIEYSKKFNLTYILGLINSKLVNFYFKLYIGDGLHTHPNDVRNLPVFNASTEQQSRISLLVDKMLSLNKSLNEIGDKKTSERAKIEEEIKKTDAEIDELVYKMYGLTKEEIKIIEESLK